MQLKYPFLALISFTTLGLASPVGDLKNSIVATTNRTAAFDAAILANNPDAVDTSYAQLIGAIDDVHDKFQSAPPFTEAEEGTLLEAFQGFGSEIVKTMKDILIVKAESGPVADNDSNGNIPPANTLGDMSPMLTNLTITLTQAYGSWNSTTKLTFNTDLNMIRSAIWNTITQL